MKKNVNRALVAKKKFSKISLTLLAGLLLTFAFPVQGWGDSYYYARLTAHVSADCSARGLVYAGTGITSPAENDYGEDVPSSTKSVKNNQTTSCDFYAFAKTTNDDYKFLGWSEVPSGATQYDNNDAGQSYKKYSVVASGTSNDAPNNKNVYAYFARKIYAKAAAGIDSNGTGTGTVYVAWEETTSPAFAISSETTDYDEFGSTATQESIKKDVYFYAKGDVNAAGKDMVFKGWYDENGNEMPNKMSMPYKVEAQSFSGESASEVGLTLYARFNDPDKVAQPKIELEGQDGATDLTLKIDEEQVVSFVNVDETILSMLNNPSINVVKRVDVDDDPIVIWDAANRKLTANRAGTATVTFSHPTTDDFNSADFTFTIHVEKYDPTFSWKTSTLFIQEYELTDLIETPSDGAWSLTSNDESVFASLSSVGTTSTTPSEGSVTLTFSQSASYRYNAIQAQSQEFKVYNESALAMFSVNNTSYNMLAEAITASTAGGKKYNIIVTKSGMVVPGDYTIPSGVTLLVPYDDANTLKTTKPSITSSTTNDSPTNGCYRTLTLPAGVNITVKGSISVGGDMQSRGGGKAQSGCIYSAFGKIDMLGNSTMTIKNGGSLYVWGYIMSSDYKTNGNKYLSSIIAENGSTVYEAFQFENHGGTCLSNTYQYVFLVNQYYVQNIETPLILQYGATEKVYGAMYIRGNQETSATLIGSGGLFVMNNSSSYMRKYFDPVNDRQVYEAYGDISMSSITVKASVGSISSSSYVLPVTNNMSITIKSGSRVTITYDASLLAETQLEIEQGAEMIVSKSLFVYDAQEWCYFEGSTVKYGMTGCVAPLTYSGFNGTDQSKIRKAKTTHANMLDAKITNNGTITVNGYLLTTTSGADICSTGSGKIVFPKGGRATSTALKQVPGTESKTNTISTTPAKLHNADNSYTPTAGAPAGATFTYINGMWVRPEGTCTEVYIGANGDSYITYQGNWVKVTRDGSCDYIDEPGNKYRYNDNNSEWVKVFVLKWVANGGIFETSDETIIETIEEGAAITKPADPTREGYTFVGWTPSVPATMPAADATYTAQWTAVPTTAKYTVKHYKLHINGGKQFKDPFKTDESEVEIGSEVTPEFEVIEGYDPPAKDTTITISANPEENVVIYEYPISKDNTLNADGNIDAETEAYTVILAPGKTMNITGDGSVTAQNLVLQSVPGDNTGANLATTDNLKILGDVCIEIDMNNSGTMNDKLYYCFSVPFNVNVDDGVERLNKNDSTWSKAVLNTNYRVYTYNEYDRATNGRSDNNWASFSDSRFVPGVFYLCEFDNSNYNRYRFYAAEGASLNNKGDIEVTRSSENEKNGGWNGVANNGLTNNKLSGDFTIIQILNSEGNCFETATASKTPLAIGNAAMVQVSKEGSVVVGETPSAVAARRMGEAASTEFINVRLYKENQDKHVDQIFIRASEDAAEQYVAGIDLSKATMGTPKVARLWVNDYDLQLVANEALMTNDQATFSLGMSAPANGEYTIALNEVPTDATIYLTENGSAIWNLNIAPAPISLSKGTENSYGLRLVRKINNVVTGFDEAVLNGNVQKVILNDHLYIIRDGKVYSAHGHVIK